MASKNTQPANLFAIPIAHRGLHGETQTGSGVVENTASGFAAAVDAGYAIECDIQLSGDERAMVFHDEALSRLLKADGDISDFTSAQLKGLAFRESADEMQLLEELLQQIEARVPLIIELKSRHNGDYRLAAATARALKDYRGHHAVMSFDLDLVAAFAQLMPEVVTGLVVHEDFPEDDETLQRIDTICDFASCNVEKLPYRPQQYFRSNNKPVICWTVRSAEAAAFAYQYCDQITFEGFRPVI